jgi:hypothetical protein
MSINGPYQELQATPPFIRLFTLLPSPSADAPLKGHLEAFPLASCPPYEALSYAWGKERGIEKTVRLDGRDVFATSNLDSALRSLRLLDTPRVLWVDALCINQNSASERSHQVSLMKEIYSQCERDLLWLGPDLYRETGWDNPSEETLGKGIELMRQIGEKDIKALRPMEDKWNEYVRRHRDIPQKVGGDESEETLDGKEWMLSEDQQSDLWAVVNNAEVWTRLWIVQEAALAPKIQLFSGRHTLDWDLISRFLGDTPYADAFHGTFSHDSVDRMAWRIFYKVQSINHQRQLVDGVRSGKGESSMLDVLARFKSSSATDPRDKIYGLLSLATDSVRDKIKPDYDKEPGAVYTEVTATIINESRNLDIICQSPWRSHGHGLRNPPEPLSGHPSWAADFRIDGSVHLFAQRSIFNAGKPECQVPCQMLDNTVLVTRGVKIGRVGEIRQQDYVISQRKYYRGNLIKDLPLDWLLLYLEKGIIDKPDRNHVYEATGEPVFTAFWRTLVTDCEAFPMKRLTPEQVAEYDKTLREKWPEVLRQREQGVKSDGSWQDVTFYQPKLNRLWVELYHNWNFSITHNGLYVMITEPTREGDVIACLDGGKVPVVLRPAEHDGPGERWQLITVAYVHGFMDGEATRSGGMAEKLDLKEEELWLV